MHFDDIRLLSGGNRFGHLDEIQHHRVELFDRINRECGDIARVKVPGGSLVFANSPDLLHDVLVEKAKSFVKSPGMRGTLRPLAGEGLFTSEGDLWRQQRKLMAPLFTQSVISGFGETMGACARDAVRDLREGDSFDAARMTTHIAMRVAGKTLLDMETAAEADEIGEAITVALHWVNEQSGDMFYMLQLRATTILQSLAEKLKEPLGDRARALADVLIEPIRWPTEGTRQLRIALATIDRHVARMIAYRRASGLAGRRDLLSLLLSVHDDAGARMSDKQLRDEIVTLFVAGHETTAAALAWSLYLLARHPEALARAKSEARKLSGRTIGAEDLPSLGYCLQVFKEAMRLYPPVYFYGRQAIADVRIGEYDLPRGAVVLISTYALHRRPEIWPNPERFDPSRFERAAEESRPRQAYLPFSAGPRTCIGNHFALMEGPIVLATLLGRLDVELANDAVVAPDASATLRPKGPVTLRVTGVNA